MIPLPKEMEEEHISVPIQNVWPKLLNTGGLKRLWDLSQLATCLMNWKGS